jgi:hypothetical protein
MSALDHGVLNLPLSQRGDIDAQLDRYKRAAAAEGRARSRVRAQQTEVERAQAKAIVAGLSPDRIADMGLRAGMTATQAHRKLLSMAHWEPKKIIAMAGAK